MRKLLIAIPEPMMTDLQHIAEAESRNFSDLMRECARSYIQAFKAKVIEKPGLDKPFDRMPDDARRL